MPSVVSLPPAVWRLASGEVSDTIQPTYGLGALTYN
jgi:hypothetical protein